MTKIIGLLMVFLLVEMATLSLGIARRDRRSAAPAPQAAPPAAPAPAPESWAPIAADVAIVLPPRPALARGSEEDLREAEQWLGRLWVSCAEATRKEVDRACQEGGPIAEIEAIRRETLEGPVAPTSMKGNLLGIETLRSYDFARWFRRLQLVRSVPYVVWMYSGPEVVRSGANAICTVLEGLPDPTLGRLAASTLSYEGAFVSPRFRAVAREGVAVDLLEMDAEPCAEGRPAAEPALQDLAITLTPYVREDKEILGRISSVLAGRPDPVVRRLLLASLPIVGSR